MKQTLIAGLLLVAIAIGGALYRMRARPSHVDERVPKENAECQSDADCRSGDASAPWCSDRGHCQGYRERRVCAAQRCAVVRIDDDSACDASVVALTCPGGRLLKCNGEPEQIARLTCRGEHNTGAAGAATLEARCDADSQCPTGRHCAMGACRPNVGDGAACDRAAMCVGGRCGQGVCCSVGVCCEHDEDCAPYYDCIDVFECRGMRTERTCENYNCVTGRVVEDADGCAGQIAEECGLYRAVRCEKNRPRLACAQACNVPSDCRAGNACVGGACTVGCRTNDECGTDSLCLTGVCILRCSRDRTCPSPFSCTQMPEAPDKSTTVDVCLDL